MKGRAFIADFIADCESAAVATDFLGCHGCHAGLFERFLNITNNECGGSLHIVLGDGNHERSSVEFCLGYAKREGDIYGVALAEALLRLPDEVYDLVLPPMEDYEPPVGPSE
jgi:hypothetical protein